jgi:hypothetical protein
MSKEISQGRRNFVFCRLPIIAGALVVAPTLLIPEEAEAYDLDYEGYTRPTDEQLREFLSSQKYPEEFEFCYDIPPNRDKNGECLRGSFRILNSPRGTSLEIFLVHPKETRLISLNETQIGDSILYTEREVTLSKGKEEYNRQIIFGPEEKIATPVSLARWLSFCSIPETSFVFQGKSAKLEKYSLEAKTQQDHELELVLSGRIKGNSSNISSGKVFYRKVDGLRIPVEIHLEYAIKIMPFGILGSNYDNHTLKGILSV